MEEWSVLAHKMQTTLASIVSGTRIPDLLWFVDAAKMKLETEAYVLSATILKFQPIPLPTPLPDGYNPMDLIEHARVQLEALRRDHAMAGYIISLYGARRGILQGDPLWQTWKGHHATAIRAAQGALLKLHKAAAWCQAAKDALAMAVPLPHQSPAWVAWSSAAHMFMCHAMSKVTRVRDIVLLMRTAVMMEYVAARLVQNR